MDGKGKSAHARAGWEARKKVEASTAIGVALVLRQKGAALSAAALDAMDLEVDLVAMRHVSDALHSLADAIGRLETIGALALADLNAAEDAKARS